MHKKSLETRKIIAIFAHSLHWNYIHSIKNPIWSVDGDVYVDVMERYPDKIQLAKEVSLNPKLGDTFDINEYKPTLLRYNPALEADNKWEALMIDNKNFKFVLDWDESVWTEQDKNSLPVLKRTGKARGAIVLMAEEYDPDSEEWYEIARDSYYVSTIFDKDAECSHIWGTIVDEKGNCGKAEKRHLSLKVKKKLSLTATVAPVTSKQKVTYSVSNKSIATVNAKGVITAKKKGTVTITVKSGKKKVKVKVKVTK